MNRPFYSEYVRHCLRFYTRNPDLKHFNTEVDKNNWWACESVLKNYEVLDRDIITAVYGGYDTLADNVYETAKKNNVNQNIIWDAMKDIERRIARKRGLL